MDDIVESIFIQNADEHESQAEIYHENSKLHASSVELFSRIHMVNNNIEIQETINRKLNNYRGMASINLSYSQPLTNLEEILLHRRSRRDFKNCTIDLRSFSRILLFGCGVSVCRYGLGSSIWSLRTYPSGGGLYPVGIYIFIFNIDTIEPGLYYYCPHEHQLQQVQSGDFRKSLAKSTSVGDSLFDSGACLVLSASLKKSSFKYGERAYRFILLEAGHVAHNVILLAEQEGLITLPIGGFLDDEINSVIGLDGIDEFAIYIILLGLSK